MEEECLPVLPGGEHQVRVDDHGRDRGHILVRTAPVSRGRRALGRLDRIRLVEGGGAVELDRHGHAIGDDALEAEPKVERLAAGHSVRQRLRGDYLAIVTLAFGEIIRLILINWVPVTNGYAGISGIPRPTFFGIPFNASEQGFAARFGLEFSPIYRTIFLYYLILGLALLTAGVSLRLRRLPIGRAWEALREDEIACRSLGINTTNTKLTAFAIGAMFAGFAGSFFAARQGFISPESFTFMESAVIVAIVVLGGMGSLTGVAIAAVAMIGGTEIMRELDFLKLLFGSNFDPTQYRMLLFGFAMVLIMIWKPRGLIATRYPSALLHPNRRPPELLVEAQSPGQSALASKGER